MNTIDVKVPKGEFWKVYDETLKGEAERQMLLLSVELVEEIRDSASFAEQLNVEGYFLSWRDSQRMLILLSEHWNKGIVSEPLLLMTRMSMAQVKGWMKNLTFSALHKDKS